VSTCRRLPRSRVGQTTGTEGKQRQRVTLLLDRIHEALGVLNLQPEFPTAILLVSVEDLDKSCNDSNIEHLTLLHD
jgi:hypothetical protein